MEIEFLIAHNMNIKHHEPLYSDDVIVFSDLKDKERANFTNFFGKHIETQRVSNKAKPASFKFISDIENHAFKYISEFKDCDIEKAWLNSKQLTSKLHQTMQGNSNSDGIILFVKYHNNDSNYLCIMKMDPEDGVRYDKDEKLLEVIEDMLPDSSRKLHKVSFFKLDNINDEGYSFHVLDKQQSGDQVSNFFINSFLESNLNFDDRRMNRIFSKKHDELLKVIETDYNIEDIDSLDQISKNYKALFSGNHEIQIVNEVKNIVERVTNNPDLSDEISKTWAANIEKSYGDDIYYQFQTENVTRFNTVYTDEDNRISLQYDADLESKGAVKVGTEGNEIVIRIKQAFINKFDKN